MSRCDDTSTMAHADTVVVGGGTAGAIVAGRLAEADASDVLLLEAGPDYGSRTSGRWPGDLLNAVRIPESHEWGYTAIGGTSRRRVRAERARVIGGCSSHNGCTALWGGPSDWDAIAACGCAGWDATTMAPARDRVLARLGVHVPPEEAITPYHAAWIEAAGGAGYQRIDNLNAGESTGIGVNPVSIRDGTRWNTAFAWLDPVRHLPHLTIAAGTLVDRLIVVDGRVVAVEMIRDRTRQQVMCDRVVLAAGTYATPAILQRSGLGDADRLTELGISVNVDLPGAGANLQDHPSVLLRFAGTDRLVDALSGFAAASPFAPEEQTVLRARSSSAADGVPFDIHLYPFGGPDARSPDGIGFVIGVACMTPRSRGSVRIVSADPATSPEIDLGLLIDEHGHDRGVLVDGVEIVEAIVGTEPLRDLIGRQITESDIGERIIRDGADVPFTGHYYHPVGTCRMGPGGHMDVCDEEGRIRGLTNAWIADASVFPVIPKANTCLPVAMAADAIADRMLGRGRPGGDPR